MMMTMMKVTTNAMTTDAPDLVAKAKADTTTTEELTIEKAILTPPAMKMEINLTIDQTTVGTEEETDIGTTTETSIGRTTTTDF